MNNVSCNVSPFLEYLYSQVSKVINTLLSKKSLYCMEIQSHENFKNNIRL